MRKHQINYALTSTKAERDQLKRDMPDLMESVASKWNNGRICGQCKHYSPLGGNRNLNGTCGLNAKNDYTRPADKACNKLEGIGE